MDVPQDYSVAAGYEPARRQFDGPAFAQAKQIVFIHREHRL
jgi:hypothetical protein